MSAPRCRIRAGGFSLIELMVSLALSLMLLAALAGIFSGISRSHRENERQIRLQEELRFALSQLSADLEMAGFWGAVADPERMTLDASLAPVLALPGGIGCEAGETHEGLPPPLQILDNEDSTPASSRFPCLGPGERVPGTDLVMVRRLRGLPAQVVSGDSETTRSGLVGGHVYLQNNGARGVLFVHPHRPGQAEAPRREQALDPPYRTWEYVPALYFVRPYSLARGDGLPSLCRKQLGTDAGRPVWRSECLAQGIEDLQLDYGLIEAGSGQHGPSLGFTLPRPGPRHLPAITTARVLLRARATDPDPTYRNLKRYHLSNSTIPATPADRYHRRTLATTVLLRNLAARQGVR